jgi:hypothetical protein
VTEDRSTDCIVVFGGKPVSWTCLDEMDEALRHKTSCRHPQGTWFGRFLCDGCKRRKRLREMVAARKDAENRPVRRLAEDVMMASHDEDDPDRCLVIFGNKPVSWTCLDEMRWARTHRDSYISPTGTNLGRHLCEACLRKLHVAGLSVPVTVSGPNAVPIERIPK